MLQIIFRINIMLKCSFFLQKIEAPPIPSNAAPITRAKNKLSTGKESKFIKPPGKNINGIADITSTTKCALNQIIKDLGIFIK